MTKKPKIKPDSFSDLVRDRLGRMRAHQKEMDKACDIGSEIHTHIEASLRSLLGPSPGRTPLEYHLQRLNSYQKLGQAEIGFRAWLQWAISVDLRPLEIERTVYSKRHGYAGTMDTLAELTDEQTGERVTALIDWKSSKGIYNEYKLQNAAYAVAWAEMNNHIDVPRGLIVRLPKSPDDKLLKTGRHFELCWVEPANELFPVFRAAQMLWQWQKGNK